MTAVEHGGQSVLQFNVLGYRLRVTGPSEIIDPLKTCFYTRAVERVQGKPNLHLLIEEGEGGYVCWNCDDASGRAKPACTASDLNELFWELDNVLFENSLENADPKIQIHGAAVARNGEGLLLIGDSRAGKSSLTVKLLSRGYEYFTDETIVVDSETLRLHPFPRNLMVREGTARSERSLQPFTQEAWFYQSGDDSTRWFLDPVLLGSPRVLHDARVAHIICVERTEGGEPSLVRVGMSEAIQFMIAQQVNFNDLKEKAFDTMIRLARLDRNYRLRAVHAGEAWNLLREHLGLAPDK